MTNKFNIGEEFVPLAEPFHKYSISRSGRIINTGSGREVRNRKKNVWGYEYVELYRFEGKSRKTLIHRLLAETFIPNPKNKPQVNHKDGNKLNNQLENLEWCTAKENTVHAHALGLIDRKKFRKPVAMFDLFTGDFIAKFASIAYAGLITGISAKQIQAAISKKVVLRKKSGTIKNRESVGGYIWKYAEDTPDPAIEAAVKLLEENGFKVTGMVKDLI